jgi:hypothetical protein
VRLQMPHESEDDDTKHGKQGVLASYPLVNHGLPLRGAGRLPSRLTWQWSWQGAAAAALCIPWGCGCRRQPRSSLPGR